MTRRRKIIINIKWKRDFYMILCKMFIDQIRINLPAVLDSRVFYDISMWRYLLLIFQRKHSKIILMKNVYVYCHLLHFFIEKEKKGLMEYQNSI